jgi:hypothetical protein
MKDFAQEKQENAQRSTFNVQFRVLRWTLDVERRTFAVVFECNINTIIF